MASKQQIPHCPVKYLISIFGGKWKLPIMCILACGKPVRYSQIKRALGPITAMMLSKTLKELEQAGVIIRKQYNQVPPYVEYTLSKEGKTIVPVLTEMGNWATQQMKKKNMIPSCDTCPSNFQTHGK